MPGTPGELAPASATWRLAARALVASRWLPAAAVVALTIVVFLPVLGNGFIPNWDDGINFLGTALAVYFLALRLLRLALPPATTPAALRWGAALAALLFAVHPLRIEPVAWATERRDILSGLFYVLALLCYLKAVERGAGPRGGGNWYGLTLACFAAALLSKSIVVTLPVALLVLDVYPLCRLGGPAGWRTPRPWLEKLPFFALSAVATVVAFSALLPLGNARSVADMGMGLRALLSVYGLAFYLFEMVLPLDLSPLYPVRHHHLVALHRCRWHRPGGRCLGGRAALPRGARRRARAGGRVRRRPRPRDEIRAGGAPPHHMSGAPLTCTT